MPIKFLLDENVEMALFMAIVRHNAAGLHVLEVAHVCHQDAPPNGTPDPQILAWAQAHDYILLSHDRSTLPAHFAAQIASGHTPGILILKRGYVIPELIETLCEIAYASDPAEWTDRLYFLK